MTIISQINCPNCQGVNTIKTSKSKIVVCSNCGALIATDSLEVSPGRTQKQLHPMSDLKLGLTGNLDNHKIEIVGYILYEDSDDEDTWFWEEWFGVSVDGYFWIQYDPETDAYTYYKQIQPTPGLDLESIRNGSSIVLSNSERFSISETGNAKVKSLAGELPWKVKIGETVSYADGQYYQNRYAIEWDDTEIEVYKGREIDRKELFISFRMDDKLAALIKKEQTELKWKYVRTLLWISILISIIGAIYSSLSGKLIYSKQVEFCPDPITPSASTNKTIPYSLCEDTEVPLGPINLTHANRVYKISVNSLTASKSNYVSLDINLLDSGRLPISGFEGDFWVEDWVEGGESGTESNLKADKLFQLDKAGQYYLDMEADKGTPSTSNSDKFNIKIYENIILARYFIVYASIALLVLGLKDGWLIKMLQED